MLQSAFKSDSTNSFIFSVFTSFQKTNIHFRRYKKTRNITFIKTKFKKSDDKTNIDKQRVAKNNTEYNIISKLIFLKIIIPKFRKIMRLFHVKNVYKNSKIDMFKMNAWTFWSQLSRCYAFYIVPTCIRNYHNAFEIYRTIFTYLN